ncbi:hypothetical protein [Prosthecobacter dejongeii]|uniref:Peptidase S54 rhomboid domain-containing protein n=1 Tax=Prosthecobacter dejongeii TaxID=48465 RepID=A0A7W7YKB1_9BACT|nr:hypothetical protein [Prosthecobacter dejongeii]MBB5037780.1 hypothetical protein [Prosthecobacter dejongeii]
MPLIDSLESRLGRFAIPGIIQAIAALQLFTLIISIFIGDESRPAYEQFLLLKPDLILQGQVWRLFTYIFIPSQQPLFAVIGALFMMWLGRGLDEAWGPFRVNLYVIGGMISLATGALIFGYEANAMWFYFAALFAFATFFPNEEILLFFILPVKIKWIAIFAAATLGLNAVGSPALLIPIFFALLNYAVAFGPGFIKGRLHSAKVASRRNEFAQAANSGAAFFHQCKVCGKTEVDDPALNFRVTDAGDEICSTCRKLG